jgi:hypothetical protein
MMNTPLNAEARALDRIVRLPAPTRAVVVDDWQEVNGEVCRYFHEANHTIPGVPGAYYSFTGRQLANGSITDREMYVEIPREVVRRLFNWR